MNPFSVFYYSIRSNYKLAIFVWLTRFLLAFAFIPSGMKKVLGQRFTNIGIEHPIGFFFEALYRSGMYWNFIGWGQIFAALLLMTQRFSTLGNIIYFFIISNICFITLSMHFTGKGHYEPYVVCIILLAIMGCQQATIYFFKQGISKQSQRCQFARSIKQLAKKRIPTLYLVSCIRNH